MFVISATVYLPDRLGLIVERTRLVEPSLIIFGTLWSSLEKWLTGWSVPLSYVENTRSFWTVLSNQRKKPWCVSRKDKFVSSSFFVRSNVLNRSSNYRTYIFPRPLYIFFFCWQNRKALFCSWPQSFWSTCNCRLL